ncbi:hypothetical protein Angca_009656 [Angiostrongylus cantonensis]|nr:hypothetical protein Angca_009656 [Angiostrongylus cantonensis]
MNGSFQTRTYSTRDGNVENPNGPRAGYTGGSKGYQNTIESSRFRGRNKGYSGFSTGSFGIMGDAEGLSTKPSDEPLESCVTSEEIPVSGGNVNERIVTRNSYNSVKKCGAFLDMAVADTMRSRSLSCCVVNNSRGSCTSMFNVLAQLKDCPQRRARSVSQTGLRASCDEIYTKGDEQSGIQQSLIERGEEEDGFRRDEDVRAVHNDENINNCRLSKLSIHTNNDEFFFVGGHPPSDGGTNLTPRGSLSRNSMCAADFLPSSIGVYNNHSSTIMQTSDTGQCSNVYDCPCQAPAHFTALPTANLRSSDAELDNRLQSSSQYNIHASVLGFVSEDSPNSSRQSAANLGSSDVEVNDICTSSEHNIHAGIPSFAFKYLPAFSTQSTTRSLSSNAEVNDIHTDSHNSVRTGGQNIISGRPQEFLKLSSANLNSFDAGLSHHLHTSSQHSCSGVYDIKNEAHPYLFSADSVNISYSDVNDPFDISSRQGLCASSHNVLFKGPPDLSRMSAANSHGTDEEQNNRNGSGQNIGSKDRPDSSRLSTANLHSSDAKLNIHLHSSLRNICSDGDHMEEQTPSYTSRFSTPSLHIIGTEENDHLRTSSHYSIQGSGQNIEPNYPPDSSKISTANLHSSEAEPNHHLLTASQYSISGSGQKIGSEDRLDTSRLSTANLHSSDSEPSHHFQTTSQYSIRTSSQNIASAGRADSSGLSTANMHSSDAEPSQHLQTSSLYSISGRGQNIGSKDRLDTSRLSTADLHCSDAEPGHHLQTSSQYSISGSGQNISFKDRPNTSGLSTAISYSSHAEINNLLHGSSLRNICSNADYIEDQKPPYSLRFSTPCLHIIGTEGDRHLRTSGSSIRGGGHVVGSMDPSDSLRLSTASLHSCGAEPYHYLQTSSQYSINGSDLNIGFRDRPDTSGLSTAILHSSDAELNLLHASSQRNICSDGNHMEDQTRYSSRFSTPSLHITGSEINDGLRTSSHYSTPESGHNVPSNYSPESSKLSAANLRCSDVDVNHSLHACSQHNIDGKVHSFSSNDLRDSSKLLTANIRCSDLELSHLHASSQHSIRGSVENMPFEDDQDSSRLSTANVRGFGAEHNRPLYGSSQQHICASVQSVGCSDPSQSSKLLASKSHALYAEPGHEVHASSGRSDRSSVGEVECHKTPDSLKFSYSNLHTAYTTHGRHGGVNADSIPPSTGVDPSSGTISNTLSRTPSLVSVHGFETNSGGLWYHFSDSERYRGSVANKSSVNQTTAGSTRSSLKTRTTSVVLPKKPVRSRSSSASGRNEVNFCSIPQLYSHPDDRFGVDLSGEPFRRTSEHKSTPYVPKSGSRLRLFSGMDASGDVASHKECLDVDSQLLTIPIDDNSGAIFESTVVNENVTPMVKSSDIVPPPLLVTSALTPKRPLPELDDQDDFFSPAGFNRTHFSREAYLRRWTTEPQHCEIGIQTGETIRLRQGMSFREEPVHDFARIAEQGRQPEQSLVGPYFERRASNSLEMKRHPTPVVLNAVLQQPQKIMKPNEFEDSLIVGKTPTLAHETGFKTENDREQHEVMNRNFEKKRSFTDSHHQYETRTHQEWISSTRTQWEGRKLDENSNELQSDNWNEMKKRFRVDGSTGVSESPQQFGSANRASISGKVFEPRETVVGRCEGYEGEVVADNCTIQHLKRNQFGEEVIRAVAKPEKLSQKVHETSGTTGSDHANVIPRETIQHLRQEVMDESRQPSTPKTSRVHCFDTNRASIGIEKPSARKQVEKFSITSNHEISSPIPPSRISVNFGRPSVIASSQKFVISGSNNERSDSTYKWQVRNIDTKTQYREPDVRSNAARPSNCGSTVRRHIPRGRIRDLAELFDRMAKNAAEDTSPRGKSLPPPRERTECTRSRSAQRTPDSQIDVSKSEPKKLFAQFGTQESLAKKPPLATQDVANESVMVSSRRHITSSDGNNYIDTHALPFHGLNLANQQLTGLESKGEVGTAAVDEDEVISTDSRVERRMTPTPLENCVDDDLANAFGVPSMPSSNYSAILGSKYAGSEFNGCTHFSEHNRLADIHTEKRVNPMLDEPDSHCKQPAVVREALPPQRLSLINRNSTESGCYSQHKQSANGQHCRSSLYCDGLNYPKEHHFSTNQQQSTLSHQESYSHTSRNPRISTHHYSNIEQEKVDGEIDRMFEFVEMSHHRTIQHMSRAALDLPARFSPLTAPAAGIGVSTYKSREGTIGEKVHIFNHLPRSANTHPSALATSTPVDSPLGTGYSQGEWSNQIYIYRTSAVPNLDDSFVSSITAASNHPDTHEEYKRQIAKLNNQIHVQEEQIDMTSKVLALARKKQKSMQELSAQRTLLLARERLDLLRCEVNRISALSAVRNPPPPVCRELRGTMTISNITVHLNRSFCQRQLDQDLVILYCSASFNPLNKLFNFSDCSYALLILLKCGTEVEATGPISLFTHHQVRARQLTFGEHVQFANLPVDFNVIVEVYAMKLPISKANEHSCASNIANKCRSLLNPGC